MKARGLLVLGLAASIAASGCVIESTVTFTPMGDDFSVDGAWLINGEAPSAANCAEAGIDTVQVVFWDNEVEFTFDALTFNCEVGSFDTRPSPILAYGSYTTEWVARNTSGAVIARGGRLPLTVASPTTHATLATADFRFEPAFDPSGTDAELTGDWTIGGMAANAASCADAGIATVELVFFAQDDTAGANGVVMGSAACSTGKFDSMPTAILAYGAYQTRYRALRADMTVAAESMILPLTVSSPITRAMLATWDIPAAMVPSLDVTIQWDSDMTATMVYGTCEEATVTTMSYMLTNSGGTVVEMMMDRACAVGLAWPELEADTYSLYIEGTRSDGVKIMSTCTDLLVEPGMNQYDCFVSWVPAM